MAVQVVYKSVFQGDTYLVYRWHNKHYAFGQQRPNGQVLWSGTSPDMVTAMEAIFVRMTMIATDIDKGVVPAQGPFLDLSGKEITR